MAVFAHGLTSCLKFQSSNYCALGFFGANELINYRLAEIVVNGAKDIQLYLP